MRMQRFREWVRWEFGRPIEVTLAIRLITIERFFKAAVLFLGGIALLVLSSRTDLHRLVAELQNQLDLTGDRGWWASLYEKTLERIGGLSRTQTDAVAIGAMFYGCLEALEGVGLLLRRRWAEYLVLIATGAFLPLELEELIHKPTVFKAGALLVNVIIVVYLIWRKRLFLERPGVKAADRTEPVAADLRPQDQHLQAK
jgi:uncharacterized membrane protein (DUF2068 family)